MPNLLWEGLPCNLEKVGAVAHGARLTLFVSNVYLLGGIP